MDECLAFDEALMQKAPKRGVVVGGGYISLEMTEALIRRNVAVTLVEFTDRILTPIDQELSESVKAHLEKQGRKDHRGKVRERHLNGTSVIRK